MFELVSFNNNFFVWEKGLQSLMIAEGCEGAEIVHTFDTWKEAFEAWKVAAGWNI